MKMWDSAYPSEVDDHEPRSVRVPIQASQSPRESSAFESLPGSERFDAAASCAASWGFFARFRTRADPAYHGRQAYPAITSPANESAS
jgi:hypothetical protein